MKKFKLKNNLFLSFQEKEQNTTNKSKIPDDNNINLNDIHNNEIKNKSIFDFNSFNEQNIRNKKLSIMKNGIIYWLRKIFIIFQNNSIIVNRSKKLYFYFYYPIKEINLKKNKLILFENEKFLTKDDLFCNSLEDIKKEVKDFLKIRKKSFIKINLYNDDFNMLKSDIQLMRNYDKYKIIYAKVIKSKDIEIITKINNNYLNKNFFDKDNSNDKKVNNIYEQKSIKNSLSSDFKLLKNRKKFSLDNPNIISNKISNNKEKPIIIFENQKVNMYKKNKNNFVNITNSVDKLILDDMEGVYSFDDNKNSYLKFLLKNNNKRYNTALNKDNTLDIFKKSNSQSYKIPLIKSKGILNSQTYKIFNPLNLNSFKHKISLDIINSNHENNLFKTKSKNFRSYTNIMNKKNNLFNMNNNINILEEFKKQKILMINNNIFENIKSNQYTSKFEISQILFIALNNIIKNFISEKLNNYISDEDIKVLFDIENIIINITNLDVDMNINIYLKEFLLYLYISNYINLYHTDFCYYLYKIITKENYININNIFSINSYKNLIYSLKSMFESLISNKNNFKEKIKENYDKNEKIIYTPTFILFILYNRNNLQTTFNKDLLIDILNAIDIFFDINNMKYGFDVNQYIKFRLYLTKNKFINDSMKKEFISNFLNQTIYKNKNFDIEKFIIEIRPILKTVDFIMKIVNHKDINILSINEIYNKYIDYFNF